MSTRGSKRKSDEGQSSTTIQPAFPDLREKHKTVEKLEEHLKKLDKATLQALILNGAFPEAKSNLRHCVYCHKTFDKESNDDDECAVEHFQELQERSKKLLDEYFPCCGKIMDNADVWGDEMRAEEMEPCCYQGVHWEREITTDDEKEFDDEYLGMVYEDGEKLPVTWWREWKKHGNSCEKVGCASRATKIRR